MSILRFVSYSATILGIILIWWIYPPMVRWLSEVFHKPMDASVERLGALFSALAFAGLFITIYLQRKDFVDTVGTQTLMNLLSFINISRHLNFVWHELMAGLPSNGVYSTKNIETL